MLRRPSRSFEEQVIAKKPGDVAPDRTEAVAESFRMKTDRLGRTRIICVKAYLRAPSRLKAKPVRKIPS
jgi:hypothetical protein